MRRDNIDKLYSVAIKRFRAENPDMNFTPEFLDRMWFSIEGIYRSEGYEAAEKYVNTATLGR